MMPGPLQVDVQVATGISDIPTETVIRDWLQKVVEHAGNDVKREIEISVRIVDEDEGRLLNRRYRKMDSATNVLSFPAAEPDLFDPPGDLPLALGDIVICGPVVAREAAAQGKEHADHWAHLLVHGALHLMGYDHESQSEAQQMEALEASILAAGGVQNPYES